MDGFEENSGVVVIGATNLADMLDPALTRPGRFDRHVAVALPDVKGRKSVLDLYLSNKPVESDVDSELLARRTPGFSGADLFNMVNEAALMAATKDLDRITEDCLDEARDKILMGSPRALSQSQEARRLTAYHEGGHALVALYVAWRLTDDRRARALGRPSARATPLSHSLSHSHSRYLFVRQVHSGCQAHPQGDHHSQGPRARYGEPGAG
jgi:ATP-dependent Zn protease